MHTDIKRAWMLVLALASISMTSFHCGKNCFGERTGPSYVFQIWIEADPDSESVQVGDTIWFSLKAPVRLKDEISGTLVDFSHAANLGSAVGFVEYPEVEVAIKAAHSFECILRSGKKVKNPKTDQIREFLFSEEGDYYQFKLGVVPKDTGTFGIGFSSAGNVFRRGDRCTRASFIIDFKNTDQHFYLNPNLDSLDRKPEGNFYIRVQ